MNKIAFNTANLVARVSGYQFELKNWGDQHQRTIAETNEQAWRDICREIAATGFKAVEIWEAHAAPEALDENKARLWKEILDENGLQVIAYAGSLRPETVQVCKWLGIPHIDGSSKLTIEEAEALCCDHKVLFNYENHPEKSPEEIMDKIDGGSDSIGICVDTGWLGTQGLDAPTTVRDIFDRVRHIHLKDVAAIGGHETVLLGSGVVDIPGVVAAAKEIGYEGWYSWEDEPENRNPFDSAAQNREYIEKLLQG
jgi:sugar phosphate isomerase/epimerase